MAAFVVANHTIFMGVSLIIITVQLILILVFFMFFAFRSAFVALIVRGFVPVKAKLNRLMQFNLLFTKK